MKPSTLVDHATLVALAERIARTIAPTYLGVVTSGLETDDGGFMVKLLGRVTLFIGNDPQASSRFIVVRILGGPSHRLPFEDTYEDACGIIRNLSAAMVLELLRTYIDAAHDACLGLPVLGQRPLMH